MESPLDGEVQNELAGAEKEVLVKIVKIIQKQGLEGTSGGWKDFLRKNCRKFGDSLSDPSKRTKDLLTNFLETFSDEPHLKLLKKILNSCKNFTAVEKYVDSPEYDSPQQRLVRLTIRHQEYLRRYSLPSYKEDWIITPDKVSRVMKSHAMIAVDCEMVLCQDGTDALVQVCAVDHNLEVKLNMLVKPHDVVADYRTYITGISLKDLEDVTCCLADAQNALKKILKHGAILVGHSLNNDLCALKIDHARVVDTAYIFKYSDPSIEVPSLNNLCKAVLGHPVRSDDEPHDCVNDARAVMKLVLAKLKHGFDDPIAVEKNYGGDGLLQEHNGNRKVSSTDILLLHNVPVDVPKSELLKLFSGNSAVDIEDMRVTGETYSIYAVFKDTMTANEAFQKAQGQEYKDSGGRYQRSVDFQLKPGKTAKIFIQKNTPDAPALVICHASKKKSAETNDNDCKRQKILSGDDHDLEEVERLKAKLRKKDDKIASLQAKIKDLKRKQRLQDAKNSLNGRT